MSTPTATPVVYSLGYQTWADAMTRQFSWSSDAMARAMLLDPTVSLLLVVNAQRSRLSRLRPGAHDATGTEPGVGATRDRPAPGDGVAATPG